MSGRTLAEAIDENIDQIVKALNLGSPAGYRVLEAKLEPIAGEKTAWLYLRVDGLEIYGDGLRPCGNPRTRQTLITDLRSGDLDSEHTW